ncbi:MAG: BlaI/MecI/CopY family transcriptional regulator [Lachnospiraceae bacterium]|nr:BlaI/MecI/CopY family transcriptional regulator [Lachnospiraceae bacterium]MBQ7777052.1 BlaI/MecI/CopY family transcriptional regulator [Lachnospiraceae bacterium]
MEEFRLGVVETHFAEIIWEHEPLQSGELVKLCAKELDWKKSTTYTVLKKLCERGLFQNREGIVSALVSRNEYQAMQSERFVEEAFEGSLPQFLAAFSSRKKLSDKEIAEIQRIIDENRG